MLPQDTVVQRGELFIALHASIVASILLGHGGGVLGSTYLVVGIVCSHEA